MILRQATSTLQGLARGYPILAISGPRLSGRTTLAQTTFADKPFVSLEDLDTRAFATEDPRGFLARYAGVAALPAHLVYGGDDAMLRSGVPVHSWRDLNGLFGHVWCCT
jgi:hypothetical protein